MDRCAVFVDAGYLYAENGKDAARDGIRTQEQHEVAELANVKLRLGRLNSNNQQKGSAAS